MVFYWVAYIEQLFKKKSVLPMLPILLYNNCNRFSVAHLKTMYATHTTTR